jgi:hypothetical protein
MRQGAACAGPQARHSIHYIDCTPRFYILIVVFGDQSPITEVANAASKPSLLFHTAFRQGVVLTSKTACQRPGLMGYWVTDLSAGAEA